MQREGRRALVHQGLDLVSAAAAEQVVLLGLLPPLALQHLPATPPPLSAQASITMHV